MNKGLIAGLLCGITLTAALVAYYGFSEVVKAVAAAGWLGVCALVVAHLPSLILCGIAWRSLLVNHIPHASRVFVWARLVKDGFSNVLAMAPISGELIAFRVITLHGVKTGEAAASCVVDLTMELLSQFVFTLMGLGLLCLYKPNDHIVYWATIGMLIAAPALAAFVLLQHSGISLINRMSEKLAKSLDWPILRGAIRLQEAIRAMYQNRYRLCAAFGLHLAAWLAGVFETWLGLYFLGHLLELRDVLVIESLVFALRTIAFFVPGALGVQEGGYILLGGVFGLGPDVALALSLLKRGRDVVLSVPAFVAWPVMEGGRLWRGTVQPAEPKDK